MNGTWWLPQGAIMDLGLTLIAEDEGRSMALFKECVVRVDGDTARVRC